MGPLLPPAGALGAVLRLTGISRSLVVTLKLEKKKSFDVTFLKSLPKTLFTTPSNQCSKEGINVLKFEPIGGNAVGN